MQAAALFCQTVACMVPLRHALQSWADGVLVPMANRLEMSGNVGGSATKEERFLDRC